MSLIITIIIVAIVIAAILVKSGITDKIVDALYDKSTTYSFGSNSFPEALVAIAQEINAGRASDNILTILSNLSEKNGYNKIEWGLAHKDGKLLIDPILFDDKVYKVLKKENPNESTY